jgi:hypothetical protein
MLVLSAETPPANANQPGGDRTYSTDSTVADDPLTLLQRRLEAYTDTDPAAALDPEALVLAAEVLVVAVPKALEPSADQSQWALAVRVPATLHLIRARALNDATKDVEAAAALFGIVKRAMPEAVAGPFEEIAADPAIQDSISQTHGVFAWERHIAVLDDVATRAGSTAVVDAAALLWSAAINDSQEGSPAWAGYWRRFCATQMTRFKVTGSAADLDKAISLCRRVLDSASGGVRDGGATAMDQFALASILALLSDALCRRFERAGAAADLDAAVEAGQAAVAAAPPGHPDLPASLSNLALALESRSDRAGSAADLDAAVEFARTAVSFTAEDDPLRARALSNLSSVLRVRSRRTSSLPDLDAAVAAAQAAVATSAAGEPDYATFLSRFGNALLYRFERTGSLPDLDIAVEACRAAVASIPPGHPSQARLLGDVGGALLMRFQKTGALSDLDGCLEASQAALAATPADDPTHGVLAHNIAVLLETRAGHPHAGQPKPRGWRRARRG